MDPCHCATLAFALLILSLADDALADQFVQLHAKGQKLPFTHMGPFVTRGDDSILAVDARDVLLSSDHGKTWQRSPRFKDAAKFMARPERALIRTRSGAVVTAFLNEKEKRLDRADWRTAYLPVYVTRSLDDGLTWEEPQKIQDGWCGAVRSLIQLKSGRLVLPCQIAVATEKTINHVAHTYVSDDDGKTWRKSNSVGLGGHGSHAGAMEPTVIELAGARLYMLIRTSQPWEGKMWFWEAFSSDAGLTWTEVRNSGILASTCCGTFARLASGRIALLWNRPEEGKPYNRNTRAELAIAFSLDECKTWSKPVVVARRPLQPGEKYYMARQSYPYLYERRPGELWITTMQGGLRMKINESDFDPKPDLTRTARPTTIVALGSSTTARRSGVQKVYEQRLNELLPAHGIAARLINAGVPSDTTVRARGRFERDVLAHRPDVVAIFLGANDSAVDVWRAATRPRVARPKYEENLRHFVQALKARGAQAILMTPNSWRWAPKLKQLYGKPPYEVDRVDGLCVTLRQYAESVRTVAKQEAVPLVDVFAAFEEYDKADGQSTDALLLDGMHPNDAGHAIIADMLLPKILAILSHEDRATIR